MDEGQQLEVRDGDRMLRFNGRLLGESSSNGDGTKTRWAEIRIFRTEAGAYIVAGVGRSTRDGEVDKHWARVCHEPGGVIEVLHMLDDDGSRYMPHTNKIALDQARSHDDELRQAFAVEVIH